MSPRASTRLAKFFIKFLNRASLDKVPDPRKARGQRHTHQAMLRTLLTSLLCGCTNLQASERFCGKLSPAARRLLKIPKPISDSALRYWLNKLDPDALRELLQRCIRQARESKSLRDDAFPWGTVAIDGRQTHTPLHDKTCTQRRNGKAYLRTITCCLTSSTIKPCLDTIPLLPKQNEESAFPHVFDALCRRFGRCFQIVTYDAGACSQANAALVDKANRGYVFALKKNQPTLFQEAKFLLGGLSLASCQAQKSDCEGGKVVTRRVWVRKVSGYPWWPHACTVVRIHTTIEDKKTHAIREENHYLVSNIPIKDSSKARTSRSCGNQILEEGLSPLEWLQIKRLHWGVENNCHCFWDKLMREDRDRWIFEPKGMLNVQLFRRIAFLFLRLYQRFKRSCTLSWPAFTTAFLHMVWTLARVPKRAGDFKRLDSS